MQRHLWHEHAHSELQATQASKHARRRHLMRIYGRTVRERGSGGGSSRAVVLVEEERLGDEYRDPCVTYIGKALPRAACKGSHHLITINYKTTARVRRIPCLVMTAADNTRAVQYHYHSALLSKNTAVAFENSKHVGASIWGPKHIMRLHAPISSK